MAETKVICDTDVIIDYFDTRQSRHNLTKRILEEKIGLDNMMLSAISRMELMAGATTKRELVTLNKRLARFDTILIDPAITELSLSLLQTYKLSHGLALPDSLIAASAIKMELPLFTYNIRDFKFIAKIKLYKH
ncbi:MAG TPA: type II toxin-antitoxin system VapC family toxin [Chryseosolibacter sp.]|nr:type II toxin-antitoxin system VapC family toxin [Chryseosolibacter sp.]